MKPIAPNTMIQNRYLIVQPIGKGGMGEVYLAVDQRLGSAVAIKRTYFSDDSALGSAFEREARILARLRHPVLPKVIDHFAENGDQFLVMEHISGDDLGKRVESSDKPFPLSWVMFWADQLLDALGYLHTHEPPIIHRDIKPQNLKLTDENHIILLDFGLSKDFDTSTAGAMNSASVAGYSPHFAAMEQIRGTGTDGRSDLYSLSATLYQLMTGTMPIDALSRADALLGGAKDPIVPLHQLNPEVPEAVSNIILKGIGLRQDERFTSAKEMQRSLRRAYNQVKSAGAPVAGTPLPPAPAPAAPTVEPNQPEVNVSPPESGPINGFDATLDMDGAPKTAELKQADINTAVMSAADLTDAGAAEKSAGNSEPSELKAVAAAAGSAQGTPQNADALPQQKPKAKQIVSPVKKSGSKVGLVLAGLFGFVVVSALAAGGGWYAYTNYYANSEMPSTPESTTKTSESPMANTTEVQNLNVADPGVLNNANVATALDNSNTPEPTGVAAKPTPPPARNASVKAQKTPTSKATPKPRSANRTVILQ